MIDITTLTRRLLLGAGRVHSITALYSHLAVNIIILKPTHGKINHRFTQSNLEAALLSFYDEKECELFYKKL